MKRFIPFILAMSFANLSLAQVEDGFGDDPVPKLSAKDLAAKKKVYLAAFDKSATAFADARLKPDVKKELAALRAKMLGVSRDRNLTLERIKDFADPARKQIEAMLALSREDVLKADAKLTADRAALIAAAPPEFASELQAAEDFAATIASLPDRKDRVVMQANVERAKPLDAEETQGIFVINVLRARLGIGALAIDVKLCDASRGHSKDMAEMNFFDHFSPVPGKEEPWDRAKAAGTSATSENIFEGSPRGEDAIQGWWHSPGHHTNMMAAGYKRIGMGRHDGYWTQMFGS